MSAAVTPAPAPQRRLTPAESGEQAARRYMDAGIFPSDTAMSRAAAILTASLRRLAAESSGAAA